MSVGVEIQRVFTSLERHAARLDDFDAAVPGMDPQAAVTREQALLDAVLASTGAGGRMLTAHRRLAAADGLELLGWDLGVGANLTGAHRPVLGVGDVIRAGVAEARHFA